MIWTETCNAYLLYLKLERGLSENTIQSYAQDVRKLIQFIEVHAIPVTPMNIASEDLQEFIYNNAKQTSPRSQRRTISGLRSFFNYLIFEGYRKDSPVAHLESPKVGLKLPDTLEISEIDALIAAIDLSTPQGERNRAILETLYGCGLRVSELICLKISDLFFDEGFIKVTGKGNKERFVPIVKATQKYINLYRHTTRPKLNIEIGHEDTLFLNRRGKGLTRAMIFTIIKNLAQTIGLKKRISPHTFRHSFATHLLRNNADLHAIQLMLGHESITTTEIYTHLNRKDLASVMAQYHPRK